MPKNAEESKSKSKMRFQSMKKPLRDVSNAKATIKPTSIHKKISENDGRQAGDDSLDRLLLVHSDLSSLLRQVMYLVRCGNHLNEHGLGVISDFGCLYFNCFCET